MERLTKLKKKYDNKEITSDEAIKQMFELFDEVGCFDGDDIKEIYEIGRAHEKNQSDCDSETIKRSWVWTDRMCRGINWE